MHGPKPRRQLAPHVTTLLSHCVTLVKPSCSSYKLIRLLTSLSLQAAIALAAEVLLVLQWAHAAGSYAIQCISIAIIVTMITLADKVCDLLKTYANRSPQGRGDTCAVRIKEQQGRLACHAQCIRPSQWSLTNLKRNTRRLVEPDSVSKTQWSPMRSVMKYVPLSN